MGVRIVDGVVHIDNSFEKEVVTLCQQYPKLYVVCMHQLRAGSAMVRFYANLPLSLRKQLPMSKTRWEITFSNGSIIRFIAFSDIEHTAIPEPPVHVVINYGVVHVNILSNIADVTEGYAGKLQPIHEELFPVLFDGNFISAGDDFAREIKKVKKKLAEDSTKMRVILPKKAPDVSKYDKAQEVLDEEAKVMRVFEDELLETRKFDLETQKRLYDKAKRSK